MSEIRTCEVKLLNRAHSLRIKNNGILLAKNTKLEFEQVDDETWAKRVSAAVSVVYLLSNNKDGVIDAINNEYGDIMCPLVCDGPHEEVPGFLECPVTGQSVYIR